MEIDALVMTGHDLSARAYRELRPGEADRNRDGLLPGVTCLLRAREMEITLSDFASGIWRRAVDHVLDHQLDVAISSPLANPGWASARLAEFRTRGYTNVTANVAEHAVRSRLSI